MITEIRAVCEAMWKNMVELERPQVITVGRMGFAKATDTRTQNM